jgi:hypothetical protein
MLHESKGAEPEESHTRYGVSSPVSVEVLLKGLMENTITTIQRRLIYKNIKVNK